MPLMTKQIAAGALVAAAALMAHSPAWPTTPANRIGCNGHHSRVMATELDGAAEHLLQNGPVLEPGEELRPESLCAAGPDAAVMLVSATRADMVDVVFDVVVYGATPAGIGAALDGPLATRWVELARRSGLPVENLPAADGTLTRGQWIGSAFALVRQ
jgi:hypothetical protein